jgi:hypothetical protein
MQVVHDSILNYRGRAATSVLKLIRSSLNFCAMFSGKHDGCLLPLKKKQQIY